MRLKIFIASLIGVLFLSLPQPALARKKLTRELSHKPQTKDYQVWDKLKLRSDKKAVLLMLGGMDHADSLSYSLTYTAGEVPQGIDSYHTPSDGNTQKELVFGTCSGSDCTYHQDITDMTFTLVVELKSGQTLTKKYQINL